MTKTDVNRIRLIKAASFEEATLLDMMETNLSQALTELFKRKNTNASRIATITGVSRSYVTELQKNKRGHKRPDRRILISICLAANATIEETDYILKTARLKELYARDKEDAILIWAMSHNKNYYQILDLLEQNGYGNYLKNE